MGQANLACPVDARRLARYNVRHMTSLLPFRPRREEREWLAGRYQFPVPILEAGEVIQTEVVMWL